MSPALSKAGYQAEDFGWHSSSAGAGPDGTIAENALMTPSERLIWVRPLEDAPLSTQSSSYYVQGFGRSSEEPDFITDPEVLSPGQTLLGIIYFLAIPAGILLASGVRARSDVRNSRMRFMAKIGISDFKIRGLLGFESSVLAFIGSAAGVCLYTVISPFLGSIPATRIELAPGSLIPRWWIPLLASAVVIVLAYLLGMLGSLSSDRPKSSRRKGPSKFPAVLLGVALGLILLSGGAADSLLSLLAETQTFRSPAFVTASLCAIILTPLSIPYFVRAVSARIRSTRQPSLWAAAKRLEANPVQSSRLASVLAGLIVLVGVAASAWTASGSPSGGAPENWSDPNAVSVSWIDDGPHAFSQLQARTEDLPAKPLALEVVEVPEVEDSPTMNKLRLPDCQAAADFFEVSEAQLCSSENDNALSALIRERTGFETAVASEIQQGTTGPSHSAILLMPADRNVPEIQRALGSLTALSVDHTEKDLTGLLPLQLWVAAGIGAALFILAIAIAREIGDESQADAERDAHYLRLGLSSAHVDRTAWFSLLLPIAVSASLSTIVAAVISYCGQPMRLTRGDLLQLAVIVGVALGFVGISLLAAWPVRRAARRL